jgi:hypothetical protein
MLIRSPRGRLPPFPLSVAYVNLQGVHKAVYTFQCIFQLIIYILVTGSLLQSIKWKNVTGFR